MYHILMNEHDEERKEYKKDPNGTSKDEKQNV